MQKQQSCWFVCCGQTRLFTFMLFCSWVGGGRACPLFRQFCRNWSTVVNCLFVNCQLFIAWTVCLSTVNCQLSAVCLSTVTIHSSSSIEDWWIDGWIDWNESTHWLNCDSWLFDWNETMVIGLERDSESCPLAWPSNLHCPVPAQWCFY